MKTQSSNKISEWVASQFFLKSCYFYFYSKRKKVSSLLATICFCRSNFSIYSFALNAFLGIEIPQSTLSLTTTSYNCPQTQQSQSGAFTSVMFGWSSAFFLCN